MGPDRVTAVQWVAVAGVVGLLVALAWLVGRPGLTTGRVVLFAALAGLAVAGALGVVTRRERLAAVAAGGLALLGFWQAVLWVVVYPVVVLLAVAAIVVPTDGDTLAEESNDPAG